MKKKEIISKLELLRLGELEELKVGHAVVESFRDSFCVSSIAHRHYRYSICDSVDSAINAIEKFNQGGE